MKHEHAIVGIPVIIDVFGEEDETKKYGVIDKVDGDIVTVLCGNKRIDVEMDRLLVNSTSFTHEEILREHGLFYDMG